MVEILCQYNFERSTRMTGIAVIINVIFTLVILAAEKCKSLINPIQSRINIYAILDCAAKMMTDPKTDITYDKVDCWWRSTKTQLFDPKLDLKYYLSTPNDQQIVTQILLNQTEKLRASTYDHSRPLRIVIHGFMNNFEAPIMQNIKNGYVKNHDVNVFIVDWSKIAKRSIFGYNIAKYHVPLVGKYVGKFIEWLSRNESDLVELANRTTIVGHSLGAHIAGYAGSYLNGALDTIVGLDPAGYKFSYKDSENRLNTTDAQHVQVIHTYGNGPVYSLGLNEPIGHSDFYPNYGASQPGCYNPDRGVKMFSCSHSRACIVSFVDRRHLESKMINFTLKYFAESLGNNKFWAHNCEGGFDEIEKESCRTNTSQRFYMGGDPVIKRNGIYYLNTNDKAPYARDFH